MRKQTDRAIICSLMSLAVFFSVTGSVSAMAVQEKLDLFPTYSNATGNEHALGCIPDSEETIQSLLIEDDSNNPMSRSTFSLPSSVDMTSEFPSPGNQGSQGSCTAWAVAYSLKTYQEKQDYEWSLGRLTHFCPSYVYNQINGGENKGTSISTAMNLIYQQGVCTYGTMSYDEDDWTSQPSQAARNEAEKYRAIDYGTIRGVDAVKKWLSQGDGVVIGIPVYPDFDNISSSNPIYDSTAGTSRGNHAVCLIGYDDSRRAFKFINSWGPNWGLSGYGYISYDVFTNVTNTGYVMTDQIGNVNKIKEVGAGDLNGDGKDEIAAIVDYKYAWTQIYTWKHGQNRPTVAYGKNEHTGFNARSITDRVAVGDFNGDGKDDIVCMYDYGDRENTLHVFLSNGAGFQPNQWWYTNTMYTTENVNGRLVTGDFNGDGKDDVAALYDYDGDNEYAIHMWQSTGTSFIPTQWWLSDHWYDVENITGRVVAGDFNHDGKDDIAALYYYGGENEYAIHVWTSTGSSFNKPSWWLSDHMYNVTNVTGRVTAGDFDGDGRDDIAAFYNYGGDMNDYAIHVWKSTGSGFDYPAWWLSDSSYNVNNITGRVVAGDFNGDGKYDMGAIYNYYNTSYTAHVFESTGTAFQKPRWTV